MCESNAGAADSNLKAYHSAESLIDGKQKPKQRSCLNNKKAKSSMLQNCDFHSIENFTKGSAHNSFEEWRLCGTDDEIGCKRTSSSVSHEELRVLTGCVTRGRVLFSPKSFQETSPSVLQVVSASTSDFSITPHCHDYTSSLECDNHKGNPPISSATNSIPDSVSVQFDCACYDNETVCKSLVEHQQSSAGSSVAAVSESECNNDWQCVVDAPLSCSIPGELNTCNAHRAKFPGLEHGLPDQSLEFPLSRAKEKSLHSSWPCHHFCHSQKENSTSALRSCSAKHVAHETAPHQVARLLLAKQHSYLPTFQGNIGMKSSLSNSVEVASALSISSCHSASDPALSLSDRPHISYSTGVDGQVFKDKTEMFLTWFEEFNDQQRNMLLQKLLERCDCAQMHFLSLQMEPILHNGCPHNCEDLLSWLPLDIATRVLSYLDPVSLCHASKVCRSWYKLASQCNLWKALCRLNSWQFSLKGETEQLEKYTLSDCTVQWKEIFAERFRVRRNWRKGYCNVRTFEGHTQGISCIQFDSTRIVSGSWDKTIKVWNRRTNTAWAALTLAGHSGTVRCLHLHGNRLVSGSSDRTIKVWDLATDKVGWVGAACRATMVGHMHTVRCLQADDDKVISGSYDLTLKVWDVRTGYCQQTLRGHTDAVLCLQFDENKLVSGSKDTTIKIWSLQGGVCKLTLHGHEAAVSCLQFDETRIISGALDRLIKIWNITNGECLRTIDWIRSEGHTGVVRHLQADRWKIVSAADDKTLKVWSAYTGDRLLTLKSHTDGVTCLQFDDKVIVSGSYDRTVKLWDFSAC